MNEKLLELRKKYELELKKPKKNRDIKKIEKIQRDIKYELENYKKVETQKIDERNKKIGEKRKEVEALIGKVDKGAYIRNAQKEIDRFNQDIISLQDNEKIDPKSKVQKISALVEEIGKLQKNVDAIQDFFNVQETLQEENNKYVKEMYDYADKVGIGKVYPLRPEQYKKEKKQQEKNNIRRGKEAPEKNKDGKMYGIYGDDLEEYDDIIGLNGDNEELKPEYLDLDVEELEIDKELELYDFNDNEENKEKQEEEIDLDDIEPIGDFEEKKINYDFTKDIDDEEDLDIEDEGTLGSIEDEENIEQEEFVQENFNQNVQSLPFKTIMSLSARDRADYLLTMSDAQADILVSEIDKGLANGDISEIEVINFRKASNTIKKDELAMAKVVEDKMLRKNYRSIFRTFTPKIDKSKYGLNLGTLNRNLDFLGYFKNNVVAYDASKVTLDTENKANINELESELVKKFGSKYEKLVNERNQKGISPNDEIYRNSAQGKYILGYELYMDRIRYFKRMNSLEDKLREFNIEDRAFEQYEKNHPFMSKTTSREEMLTNNKLIKVSKAKEMIGRFSKKFREKVLRFTPLDDRFDDMAKSERMRLIKEQKKKIRDAKDRTLAGAKEIAYGVKDVAVTTKDMAVVGAKEVAYEAKEVKDMAVEKAVEVKDKTVAKAVEVKDKTVAKANEIKENVVEAKDKAVEKVKEKKEQIDKNIEEIVDKNREEVNEKIAMQQTENKENYEKIKAKEAVKEAKLNEKVKENREKVDKERAEVSKQLVEKMESRKQKQEQKLENTNKILEELKGKVKSQEEIEKARIKRMMEEKEKQEQQKQKQHGDIDFDDNFFIK